jgi:hypothetical protein
MSEKTYNDVFISYARKNRDFAKKLVAAIEGFDEDVFDAIVEETIEANE